MSRYVQVTDVTLHRATDAAVLIEIDGEEYWIPFSQMAPDEEIKCRQLLANDRMPTAVSLSITRWIAEQKGIEGDE